MNSHNVSAEVNRKSACANSNNRFLLINSPLNILYSKKICNTMTYRLINNCVSFWFYVITDFVNNSYALELLAVGDLSFVHHCSL